MPIKFVDKSQSFYAKNETAMDRALGRMTVDVMRISKLQVPVGKRGKKGAAPGALRASGGFRRIGLKRHVVFYNKEYAPYQHEGSRKDGSHVIKKHSKPGTKTKFLIDPVKEVIESRGAQYFREEASKIKV